LKLPLKPLELKFNILKIPYKFRLSFKLILELEFCSVNFMTFYTSKTKLKRKHKFRLSRGDAGFGSGTYGRQNFDRREFLTDRILTDNILTDNIFTDNIFTDNIFTDRFPPAEYNSIKAVLKIKENF
jgi:hypothetical protein